jgi:antitoxin VapB
MGLNIRNAETENLADALARLTGETKTDAVTKALRERLARVRRERGRRLLTGELNDLALQCARLPVLDQRSDDQILGYDSRGTPD